MGPTQVSIERTSIPGMLVVHLPVHRDARGWFKENWQRRKMVELGLPDFAPVQNNISFNAHPGATRGIHAEPWDKLVSVATGRVFGAWVDLREGDSFGTTFHLEIDPSVAVFVPRGVGNSYQTLEDATAYSYLVNAHWRPGVSYPALHLADETVAVPWPIRLADAEVSDKDRENPRLADVAPMKPGRVLILGGHGQLAKALRAEFPDATVTPRTGTSEAPGLDVTDPEQVATWSWGEYDVVLNAAAHTAVDSAETAEGRLSAWATNATGPATLAGLAREHGFTLVHYSSDYVFDGTAEEYGEDDPVCPLGVYGQSKAAGDLAVCLAPQHYVLRTSWMVGEGANFVRTMARLADTGVSPRVVDDQIGRLTFASEVARATRHLLDSHAPYGLYNCTSSGPAGSWSDVARRVFELRGRDSGDVTPVSTAEYAAGKALAPRPPSSKLSLAKLAATGFEPIDASEALRAYVSALQDAPPAAG